MTQDNGAPLSGRAVVNGAGQAVSALRASVPSAGFQSCSAYDLFKAIVAFRSELPGWWFTVGECSVSADASCGPDVSGPDAHLLKMRLFDEGFHADLPQPANMADALAAVTAQAIETRRAETERLGAQHESAVAESHAPDPEGDAPNEPLPDTSQDNTHG